MGTINPMKTLIQHLIQFAVALTVLLLAAGVYRILAR